MKSTFFVLTFFSLSVLAFSQSFQNSENSKPVTSYNPIIPDFIADPSVVMLNDTFYMYATTDIDQGLKKMGPPVVWKSKDFVNWNFSGTILPEINWNDGYEYIDSKGAKKTGYFRYWAPGKPIKQDNKYYLFPTIVKPDEKLGTYVVVADRPEGPFRFVNGTGVYFNDSTKIAEEAKPIIDDIDGESFVDNDGKAYIYWRRRFASALSDDLLSLTGDKISIPTKFTGYSEGPLLFKRNHVYYYLYTLSGGSNYCYGYMMSKKSPLGPFEAPNGPQIFVHSAKQNNIWGPGHGNVLQLPGTDKFIFLYLEYGEGSTTRQVFANRMEFNADSTIKLLVPDGKGLGNLGPLQNSKPNLAIGSKISASSFRDPRKTEAKVIPDPNKLTNYRIDNKSGELLERTFTYNPVNAADGSNGTRWVAKDDDKAPWLMIDLGKAKKVTSCEMAFTFPSYGHAWVLEKSVNGKDWEVCGKEEKIKECSPHIVKLSGKARYLRVTILKGSGGIWEMKVY
jgi:hypothetical protein